MNVNNIELLFHNQQHDRSEGIAHLPLPDSDRVKPEVFLRNFGGYGAVALGRLYQERIRE